MGEQPAALLEGVRIAQLDLAGRRVADVGDEHGRLELARLAGERRVRVGGERLLGQLRLALLVEPADPGAVRLAAALPCEAVRRLEQPERRAHAPVPAAHAEKPAHDRSFPSRRDPPMPANISAMSDKPDGAPPASPRQVIAAMAVHAPSRRNRKLAGLLAAANANDKLKARWHGQQMTAQRLGMSDHSWVHLQIVLNSALRIFRLLRRAGVPSAIETDYGMKSADAEVVIAGGCLLHDLGMSIHRVDHESFSLFLAADLLDDLLADVYDDPERTIVASEILHAIIGHRTGGRPLTLEAGVVRVADALDMEHGRSRVSLETHLPNIHSLSAAAIDEVRIVPGEQRTIRVEVEMNNSAGVFQVDDLLATKLRGSGLEDHIEVVARIDAEHEKRLLTVYRI